ncbi:serine carboxypeptidase-like 38 [Arabidopsis thaliana]|uniref:Serine carboxypeptidase-like 38 n=1 Tax=Arabidopsis thaliana TaxID=3702 RepID=SCP38_ARATH|nr:serine carboxypeptidase-like 38 [Arabidopsis thaliana]Q9ZUG3.1 RecName: Full=Serine carboxypeptidase-like 38; Flags: Precursor [Arabidopsis thaliana]AAC95162.1 putative serine carboxypeptidase II [Arabidopsis thaliana]AAL38881.1 putative serine carboxypeptidase II [Arabidopsis thaliana]AAN41380.1 putative serine carboxypeptidase II [Arabidopsis thaliana]AEC05981.1 serine carboxypeptidase-like 38 [Arabidopsis thaliana]|eukprot:NP_178642.1 serine carboxypeptidase-like 38 [Arabidopsis thaliana]
MGKQQDWSVTACIFLSLSLASQIHCSSQTHFPSHKGGAGLSGDTSHFNSVSRENVLSLKEKDLIEKLPGQPSGISFRQYGGYVAVNEPATRFLYYYFVEAIKPSKSTPLVLWFNGGPGCSSVGFGAFEELGPFRVHSDGKTLYRNPYSWNNEANMLFFEGPISVGFSYSSTPFDWEIFGEQADKLTAEDNYMFLVNWLERFPEYKGRDVYISGQSYAGHYIPQLAQIILHRNNQTFINLRGISIGNPGLDLLIEADNENKFILSHGLVSQKDFEEYSKVCDFANYDMDECPKIMPKFSIEHNKHLDVYNIYAPVCLNSTLSSEPKKCTTIMEVDPCRSNYVKAYLNSENVQEAMHANTTKLPYEWKACNHYLNSVWIDADKDASMVPILHDLMGEGVRVLVYSGDVDAAIPFTATMAVLKTMNLTVVNEWRPWFTGGQLGGFTEDYERNLTYATVKGSGHSVPLDQPVHALNLFTSFIRNTPLPQTP